MSYNDKPTAEHVQRLAESYRTEWSAQAQLDEALLSYLMLTNQQDVAKGTPTPPKGFRSGIGYSIMKQDADLLNITPGIVLNPLTESPKDKEHASKLENWCAGAWKRSQISPVWVRLPQDLVGLGRAWDNLYPSPRVWGSSRYQKLLDRLAATADDSEANKQAKEDIKLWKRDNWPIQWRYVAPRQTWTTFTADCWLPEVVEIRKMTIKQIEAEYPDSLPRHWQGKPGSSEVDVYEYANHEWCAVVIGGKRGAPDTSGFASTYQHSMGLNPYGLCEAQLLPENDQGLRWSGTLFSARQMIDVHDQILAELHENHRDNTKGQIVQKFDPDYYDEDAKVAGRPKVETIQPGGPPIALWTTESFELTPVPEINQQSILLLEKVQALINTTKLSPALRGEAKSGTSQNQYVTQVQIAERATDPYTKGMSAHAEYAIKRMFRAVQTLDEPIAIYSEKGLVEIGPSDVMGQENAVNARMDRAIPIDKNLINQQASVELNALGLSRETVYEETLGKADPLAEIRKAETDQLRRATFEQAVIPQTVQTAQGKLATPTPEQYDALAALFQTASPDLQQMIGAAAMNDPELAGRIQQGMANVGRTGVPQVQRGPAQQVSPNGY